MLDAATGEVVLRMRGIEKRFGALRALAGVDLELRRGEVHALIGENGAGKSTLMKVLSGAYAADAGSMELGGQPYAPRTPLAARQQGVAMIYQELALIPELSVEQNVVLGREPERFGVVDRKAQRARVEQALSWLDQPELRPERKLAELAPGARQLVEVARALVGDARLVVLDEPTSSLSRGEAERLFEVIDRLRSRGTALIFISHFLEEVRRVAQRFTVLRDGRSVAAGEVPRASDPDDGFAPRVVEAMAGRQVDDVYPRVPHAPGEVLLELSELSGVRLPRAASLTLRRGEILGIAGLVGAGRSELLRALFGLDPLRSGRVRIAGALGTGAQPWQRLAQGVGLLSEDRKQEGLALALSIADNVTLSRPLARLGVIDRRARDRSTRTLAERLGLRHRDPQQPVGELSGGNQQKVALARLLHHDVEVLLLDEPTRGIDVASKADIYRLMGELAARGKAILFVSSYLPELLGVCDRIAVMSRGRLLAPRPAQECDEASLLAALIDQAGIDQASIDQASIDQTSAEADV
jgi:ribose transport system ATP-binding protein